MRNQAAAHPHSSSVFAALALTVSVLGVVLIGASPEAGADAGADLRCSATPAGDDIALSWSASPESPTVHVRQALADGSTKWRLTTEETMATLPSFAFGIDADYLVRYRAAGVVTDVSCVADVVVPPPAPNAACIQVEIGGGEAYLTWNDFGGSRYAIREGELGDSRWRETTTRTRAVVPTGTSTVIRSTSDKAEVACDRLLDLDPDPNFECTLLPRFTTEMQLRWTDDGAARHQVRQVNVAAYEDQFRANATGNVLDVPVGPLYFIRRDTGDTPCLPVAADGSPATPCVLVGQPRSVALDAGDCTALTSIIESTDIENVDNPCNVAGRRCNDGAVTALSLDLGGRAVPPAIGDLPGLRSLTLLDGTGELPASIASRNIFELTLGGDIGLPDLSDLRALEDLRFVGDVPTANVDTLRAKDVVVEELDGAIPARLGSIGDIKRLTVSTSGDSTIPQALIVDSLRELTVRGDGVAGSLPDLNRLVVLDLATTGVSGDIPEAYGASSLRELWLSGTDIGGTLPDFGQADDLELLAIGDTKLTGEIPTSLGESTSLVFIDLRKNDLSGEIPASLADIPTLRRLNLSKNDLEGSLPDAFSELRDDFLRLDLSGNRLSGTIPASWGALVGITNGDGASLFGIDLSDNLLTGPLPEFTGEEIVFFDLRGNAFSGDITDAAAHGFENDINFRWEDGPGGNNCLTVTADDVRELLDAAQPGWDRCD